MSLGKLTCLKYGHQQLINKLQVIIQSSFDYGYAVFTQNKKRP